MMSGLFPAFWRRLPTARRVAPHATHPGSRRRSRKHGGQTRRCCFKML